MRQHGRLGRRRVGPPVYAITAARRGLREDVEARTRRYLLSMGIRTVCFVLAVVTPGWPRWAFLVGALVLPYLAVVIANGGREPVREPPTTMAPPPRPMLGPGGPASSEAPSEAPSEARGPDAA